MIMSIIGCLSLLKAMQFNKKCLSHHPPVGSVLIRVSMVREKVGGKFFFKVREWSGNFEICQGILEFKQKSGKSQGIWK